MEFKNIFVDDLALKTLIVHHLGEKPKSKPGGTNSFQFHFTFSWENGENHILFNVVPPEVGIEALNTDRAMIAGADFDSWTYRTGFDIVLPFLGYVRDEAMKSLKKKRK